MSAPIPPPTPGWWRWAAWPFAVKVALIGGAVIAISTIGALLGDGWSSFPGWLEAVATFTALTAAVAAARYAAGAFHLESLREDRWVEQQRSLQADQVAAWFMENVNTVGGAPNPAVALINASPLPVYDVRVTLVGIPGLSEESEEELDRVRKVPSTVGPTGETPLKFALEGNQLRAANRARQVRPRPSVVISFTDAQGSRWIRRSDGKLLRIADPWETGLE